MINRELQLIHLFDFNEFVDVIPENLNVVNNSNDIICFFTREFDIKFLKVNTRMGRNDTWCYLGVMCVSVKSFILIKSFQSGIFLKVKK